IGGPGQPPSLQVDVDLAELRRADQLAARPEGAELDQTQRWKGLPHPLDPCSASARASYSTSSCRWLTSARISSDEAKSCQRRIPSASSVPPARSHARMRCWSDRKSSRS